jgi:hypothetical protein
MADYHSWPLWWDEGTDEIGNINPEWLGLDPALVARLHSWSAAYDSFLDWNDPGNTKEPPQEIQDAFESQGLALWQALQLELEGRYMVVYFSEKLKRVVKTAADYESL